MEEKESKVYDLNIETPDGPIRLLTIKINEDGTREIIFPEEPEK